MTKDKRTLKDLNLMDKFLFDEAMEDKDNMKTLLDIVLGQDTHLKYPPQTEKEFRNSKENRQIRLDVYAIDEDDVVYDTEPQKQNTKNLHLPDGKSPQTTGLQPTRIKVFKF